MKLSNNPKLDHIKLNGTESYLLVLLSTWPNHSGVEKKIIPLLKNDAKCLGLLIIGKPQDEIRAIARRMDLKVGQDDQGFAALVEVAAWMKETGAARRQSQQARVEEISRRKREGWNPPVYRKSYQEMEHDMTPRS